MAARPRTALLVPGAGNHPAHYEKLVFFLQANAFDVRCIELPTSNGARPPNRTYHDDVAAIRAAVEPLVDAGLLVFLVMHSYGGTVGNDAVRGLLARDRAACGLPGGIAHLFYLAAYILTEGVSIWDLTVRLHLEDFVSKYSTITDDGVLIVKDPAFNLGLDLDDHEQDEQGRLWSPFPISIFHEPAQFCPWKHVPCTYFYCSEDLAMPHILQSYMLECVDKLDVDFDVVVFNSGHSPHVNFTGDICQKMTQAAEDLEALLDSADCEDS